MISASSTDLARHCLWWARPDSPRVEHANENVAAGRAAHVAIQAVIEGRPVTHWAASAVAEWLDSVGRTTEIQAEIAFEFDCATGHSAVVDARDRSYPRRDGCIYGTADAIARTPEGLVIIDWKTGHKAPSAVDNGQLLTLAVMASSALGANITSVIIAHVTPDGVRAEHWSPDAIDLAQHRAWLQSVPALLAASAPVKGPHCRESYCQSYGLCPATGGALATVASEALIPPERLHKLSRTASGITSPEQAAWQYELLKRLKAESAAYWAALAEYAQRNGGIDLGDGKSWRQTETTRREVACTPRAINTLHALLGQHAEQVLQPTELSIGAIKAAARAAAKERGESQASCERSVLQSLEAAGVMTTKVVRKMEEK